MSEKCYVIGDEVHHRPALLKDEDLAPEIKTSGVVLRLEHAETLSDVISAAKKMEGKWTVKFNNPLGTSLRFFNSAAA